MRAVQDCYPDDFAHCYGCGRLNRDGLHVRTVWRGEETVARFTPRTEHIALPGFVYGGLIASLVDCHGVGTAAAAVERAAGREIGAAPAPRYVTASLHVDFLKPTPHGPELELVARATEITGRKVMVQVEVSVAGLVTARGTVVAVALPESMRQHGAMGPEAKATRTRFEHANPILNVSDLGRSVRYYVDILGFTNAEWGGDDFTCVSRDGASIYLSQGDQGQPGTWVWLGVDDVAVLFSEYSQSGATILQPPENFPWACEMKVGDPDGHVLRFGSDPKDEG